jgi:hypothetical protein
MAGNVCFLEATVVSGLCRSQAELGQSARARARPKAIPASSFGYAVIIARARGVFRGIKLRMHLEQAQGVALTEGNAAEAAIISVALLSGLYLKIWWQR